MEAKPDFLEIPYGRKPLRFLKPHNLLDVIEPIYIKPSAELKVILKTTNYH